MLQVPSSFAEVNGLQAEELQHLLDNDESFEVFFNSLEIIQNVTTLYESIKIDNIQTAKKNIEKADVIIATNNDLENEKELLRKEKERYDKLQARLKAINDKYSPQRIGANLQKIAKKLDDKSEEIALSFMRGNLPLGDFIRDYVDIRKKYHVIQSKSEKCFKLVVG